MEVSSRVSLPRLGSYGWIGDVSLTGFDDLAKWPPVGLSWGPGVMQTHRKACIKVMGI